MRLTVAGVALAFEVPAPWRLVPPAWAYPPFLAALDHDLEIAVAVTPAHAPLALADDARLRFTTGDGWRLHALADGVACFSMPDLGAPGRLLWRAETRSPFDRWQLACPRPPAGGRRIEHLIQYPLDQILLTHALHLRGGLLLHGAAVALGGAGMVLAGVSGAGKSTLSRALEGRDGVLALSDDRVVVRSRGGTLSVHGTPWPGDAGIARPGAHRLGALCFLERARCATLNPLAPREALERLLPVATLPWYAPELLEPALASCARLVEAVPAFRLGFTPDADGVLERLAALGGGHDG